MENPSGCSDGCPVQRRGREGFGGPRCPDSPTDGAWQVSTPLVENPRELLLQLCRRLSEQTARDDQRLDLLRALEDVEDLRVACPLLQQRALRVPQRAGEFDGLEGDGGAGPACLRFRHGRFERIRLLV